MFKTFKLDPMKSFVLLTLLFVSCASLAESGAYRVEVIIFRNLAVTAEAVEVEDLRSFSHVPSLEKIIPPVALPDEQADNPIEPVIEEPPIEPEDDLPAPRRDDLPDDLRVVNQKSPAVEDAWRRLRGSKNYRPLIYAAWEQNRTDYYPPLRIHDQNIIQTRLNPPTHIMFADLSAVDPLAAYRSFFYQIDGSVQLRRSRFLHLFLDLEFRQEKTPPSTPQSFFTITPDQRPGGFEQNDGYEVYALKQNRQIRTGQMQYFDTPHFGALVLVSQIRAD